MEILILMALACWGGTRYAVHTPLRIAERRQRADQSHQLRMARMAKRKGPTLGQAISTRIANRIAEPRGGPAREAIALWWADMWGYATDRRLRRHERAEEGKLRRQRAARAARGWIKAQWTDLTDPQDRGHNRDRDTQKPVQAEASVSRASGDETDVVDAEIVDTDETARTPAADHDHNKAATNNPTATQDDTAVGKRGTPVPNTSEQPTNPDDRLASVHRIRTTNRKEFTVSTPNSTTITSGETLDPAAARRFTAGLEEAANKLYTQTELSLSSLTGCGVSGEPISDLSAIHEALSRVIDRARSATAHFDRHLATQDQVMSDPTLAATMQGSYLSRA